MNVCKSCGQSLSGRYCSFCGEKVLQQKDRTISHLIGDFINALTFADSKLWKTIRLITLRPGAFSLNYIEGIRVHYMRPIALFFAANLLYFLFPFFQTFTTSLNTHITSNSFPHRAIAEQMVDQRLQKRGITFEQYNVIFEPKTYELSKLLLISLVLIISVFYSLIHWHPNRLFIDHLILSIELMIFILLYPTLLFSFVILGIDLLGWTIPYREQILTAVVLLCIFYFVFKAEQHFYHHKLSKSLILSLLMLIFISLSIFIYRGILFFVTFWST
jgi:hypothetical protein